MHRPTSTNPQHLFVCVVRSDRLLVWSCDGLDLRADSPFIFTFFNIFINVFILNYVFVFFYLFFFYYI